MTHPPLQIWTSRTHRGLADPDAFDITRGTADTHTKAIEEWDRMPDRMRWAQHAETVRQASTRLRAGITLVQAQALAHGDGAQALGAPWAPSWTILKPALGALDLADRLGAEVLALPPEARGERLLAVEALEAKSWCRYLDGEERGGVVLAGYHEEMRQSWCAFAPAWRWLLSIERVVLTCFCPQPAWWPAGKPWDHCHRFAAAKLLVKAGARARGAIYCGELPEPEPEPSPQLGLRLG